MATLMLVALLLALYQRVVFAASTPSYQDPSLSPKQRAEDLLKLMTWEEKIGQMGGIRRLFAANVTFNQTSFDEIYKLQNGQIGESSAIIFYVQTY